jgi:hypothetical protein
LPPGHHTERKLLTGSPDPEPNKDTKTEIERGDRERGRERAQHLVIRKNTFAILNPQVEIYI